jgi:hypothetical protein
MTKGRSEKPAFEQYKAEITKKTYKYSPEGAYKGAQFQVWLFEALSPLVRRILFLLLILGVLVFLVLFLVRFFVYGDEESAKNFLGLISVSVIIWFATRDIKKK